MSTKQIEDNPLLDVAAAAAHLRVSEAFGRRLVVEPPRHDSGPRGDVAKWFRSKPSISHNGPAGGSAEPPASAII